MTGASGFVGSHVVRALLARGYRVRGLVRSAEPPTLAGLDVELVRGDLHDRGSLREGLRDCDGLVHVGALYSLTERRSREIFATNVEGTRTLMEEALAADVRRIVYTSSVSAIGPVAGRAAREDDEAPLSALPGPYERSKRLGEMAVRSMVERAGLPAVIVNPATVIGAFDSRPTRTGQMIVDTLRGRMPAYVATGMNVVAARDVAAGHVAALERGEVGRRYILGAANITLLELLETIDRVAGRRRRRMRIPHALALTAAGFDEGVVSRVTRREPAIPMAGVRQARRPMYYDSARARTELGHPQTPLEEAVREAVEWFRANGYV